MKTSEQHLAFLNVTFPYYITILLGIVRSLVKLPASCPCIGVLAYGALRSVEESQCVRGGQLVVISPCQVRVASFPRPVFFGHSRLNAFYRFYIHDHIPTRNVHRLTSRI